VAIYTRDDRIVEIRSAAEVVAQGGQDLVDVHGKFVIPGLVNSLSAGTDDDPNWDDPNSAIDVELTLLVDKVGMTAADALRSATVTGARAAGQEHEAGSVDVGRLANLVVLNKNPLENIANIRSVYMVIKRGVRYPRATYKPVTSKEMKQYAQ
jgi:imidazolonepropionase-like amidohydrolase